MEQQSSQKKVQLKKNWSEQLDGSSWSVTELLTGFRSPSVTVFVLKHFLFTQQLANSTEERETHFCYRRNAIRKKKNLSKEVCEWQCFCFFYSTTKSCCILKKKYSVLIFQPLMTPLGPRLTLCCLETWLDTCLPEQTSWRLGICVSCTLSCVCKHSQNV